MKVLAALALIILLALPAHAKPHPRLVKAAKIALVVSLYAVDILLTLKR